MKMLWKLENKEGLKGRTMKCMESYLRGREMRTVVRDIKLKWRAVEKQSAEGVGVGTSTFPRIHNRHVGVSA